MLREKTFSREEIAELRKTHPLEEIAAMEYDSEQAAFGRLCSMGVAAVMGHAGNETKDMKTEEELFDWIKGRLMLQAKQEGNAVTEEEVRKAAVAAAWFLSRTGGFIPDVYYIELTMTGHRSYEDALFGRDGVYRSRQDAYDRCCGKYESKEEAREALSGMPTEITQERHERAYPYTRTEYNIFRTTEETSEPSCDVWIAGSALLVKYAVEDADGNITSAFASREDAVKEIRSIESDEDVWYIKDLATGLREPV